MGHKLATENEAPYPLKLVEPFVLALSNPGDVVGDPFLGSGTSGHAALLHSRRFVGADIRSSQVILSQRRLSEVNSALDSNNGSPKTAG